MELDEPEEFALQFYISIQSALRDKRIARNRARLVLQYVLGGAFQMWNVVGITDSALEEFRNANFASVPKQLNRAHIFKRVDTYNALLDDEVPKDLEGLRAYISVREDTVICLSKENAQIGRIPWYPISRESGLFTTRFIGFQFRENFEGAFLQELYNGKSTAQMRCIKCWLEESGNCVS